MKRLFIDIETSPNIGLFWRSGYKISIPPENIIKERAIICACWKFEGRTRIESATWDDGDDLGVLKKLSEVMSGADEIIGHNIDRFDMPWISTRNLVQGLPPLPQYKTVDTLKIAKKHLYLNSNRLNYLAKLLLGDEKIETGYNLWKKIVLENDKAAMRKMVLYCKKDVALLEKVWEKLTLYDTQKTHAGVIEGLPKWTCPHCASDEVRVSKTKCTPKGTVQKQMLCRDCGHYYTISRKAWSEYVLAKTGDEV